MYSYLGITQHIDLALVSLYLFWAFFAGLIYYLHRENKREGYPLVEEHPVGRGVSIVGFPGVPEPKTYILHGGHGASSLPSGRAERADLALFGVDDEHRDLVVGVVLAVGAGQHRRPWEEVPRHDRDHMHACPLVRAP